jgi:transposase
VATSQLKPFFLELQPSRVILETCAEAFAVAVDAKEAGHEVRVVPATLVRALGVGHRGIKTDVRDARCLSEASVRMDLGSVHVPSAHARELKAVCTLRDALVRSRTVLVNGVRGWMRGQLLRVGCGSTPTFTRRVRTYFDLLERELPPYVERQLLAIDTLTEQILASDQELAFLAKESQECRRVMTIPGVGPATAVRFVAAIDEISRFKTAHELESYFGLTPGELSSSDTKHRTGITKAGSAAVRWLLVQAAWAAWC